MATRYWIGTDSGNEGDYGTAANWSGATVPEAGDSVVFRNSSQDCDDTLDQSAIALTSFTVEQSYTGKIGTVTGNAPVYLQIATALLDIGRHDGANAPAGSTQLLLDLGSGTACIGTILNSATTAAAANLMPIQIIAANAGTKIYVKKGRVGFANATSGETSTIDTIDVGYVSSPASDATVSTGSGLTLETWNQTGGRATLRSATTVGLVIRDGQLRTEGSGAHPAISVYGGELVSNSTGTITLLNCYGGTTDFSRSNQARTVTTTDVWGGTTLKLNPAVVTLTNDPEPQEPMTISTSGA